MSQGTSLVEKNCLTKDEVVSISIINDIDAVYRSLQKWIDMSDEKVRIIKLCHIIKTLKITHFF